MAGGTCTSMTWAKGMVRQLTKGNWVVKDILGFDMREQNLFVSGTDMIDVKDPKARWKPTSTGWSWLLERP